MLTLKDRFLFYSLFLAEFFALKLSTGRGAQQRMWKTFEAALVKKFSPAGKNKLPIPVERVSNISPQDFSNEFLKKFKPVVLENFCGSWPAAEKWNFEYLMKHYGHLQIPVTKHDKMGEELLSLEYLLSSYLNASEHRQVHFLPLFDAAPELKSLLDSGPLRKLANLSEQMPFVSKPYIGPAHYCSNFHSDIGNNFLLNFCGEKTALLYPFSETPFLYPIAKIPLRHSFSFYAKFGRSSEPDFNAEKFPLVQFATPLEAKLFPGDVLFLPVFFWHQIHYDAPAIGVGNWWPDVKSNFSVSPLFSLFGSSQLARAYHLFGRNGMS